MTSFVSTQVLHFAERLHTDLADIGPFSCVRSLMHTQRRRLDEGFVAHLAHMRSLPRVNTLMTQQAVLVQERLATEAALKLPFADVDQYVAM